MHQAAYADAILLSTPCLADCTIVLRDGTPRRLLQWIWSVGAGRLVDGFRGTVWISHAWLAKHLGVKRGTLRQALTRLRHAGWIRDAITSDHDGHPCRGLCFANAAEHGFANAGRTLDEQTVHRPRTLDAPPPTLKLKEDQSMLAQSGVPRDPRQSSLLGPSFDAPAKQHKPEDGKMGTIKRDPRLHEVAVRVDDYERLRYDQHPRRVRSKRDTPEARRIAVEAITQALERVVASGLYGTLEAIELRFMAVVELNWEGAERKAETWDWWTGSALWAPNSLERCLGWLDEDRNWIYVERARGISPRPIRENSEPEPGARTEGLSPAEQQAEYDARHGIARPEAVVDEFDPARGYADGFGCHYGPVVPETTETPVWDERRVDVYVGVDPSIPGGDETVTVEGRILPGGELQIDNAKVYSTPKQLEGTARVDENGRLSVEITGFDAEQRERSHSHASVDSKTGVTTHHPDYAPEWGLVELVGLDDSPPKAPNPPIDIEYRDGKTEEDMREIHRLPHGRFLSVEPPKKTEEELRRELSAKAAYLLATTADERDADAKAGRKPWEVG